MSRARAISLAEKRVAIWARQACELSVMCPSVVRLVERYPAVEIA